MGASGSGLVQFYGPRKNKIDDGPWTPRGGDLDLRTIEISDIVAIKDPKRV